MSTQTHGSSCRRRVSSSLRRVNSFSAWSSSSRAASHSPRHRSCLLPAEIQIRSPDLAWFRRVNISTHIPAVSFCPSAHTPEWRDDCLPQLGQRILDSNGLRACYAPGDEPCCFEIAKSFGQHPLRDASEMAAQLSVSMRPPFKTKQNLGRPAANKDRRGTIRSLYLPHGVSPCEKAQLGTHVYLCLIPGPLSAAHSVMAGHPRLSVPLQRKS